MAIYDCIRKMGHRLDPEVLGQTRALFEPLWPKADAEVKFETAAYGDDVRQAADVFWTEGEKKPVLVFIPGGGFIGGSRVGYRALGEHFARQGYVVIIADYRLAPEWKWPAGAEDVASVIEWAEKYAARFGGCARSIFVFGHSAGGTHVAGAAFDARLRPTNVSMLCGIVLMSGIYQIGPDEARPNLIAYFGEDRARYADRSPLSHIENAGDNVLVMLAEYDPAPFAASAFGLASALTVRHGKAPRFYMAEGHNHISSVFATGTEHDTVTALVLRFVAERCCQTAGVPRSK